MRPYPALFAVCLAACAAATPEHDRPMKCDATKVQNLVGREAGRVQSAAQKRSGARTVRTYVTGSPVTMDYREDRLNIEVDPANHIVKLSCG